MGFAHHCVYLSFYFDIILEIRQYPKVVVRESVCETQKEYTDFGSDFLTGVTLRLSHLGCKRSCPFLPFHFESLRRYRSCRRHICDVDSNCELPVF